ncbi:MAG: PBP1A family penicillin-binding protein [Candidatus Blackburnbacteria bacterium]|nr:PBP1A family penicillin-binding protein [Candidatus Blackburnbacteria bacterium]
MDRLPLGAKSLVVKTLITGVVLLLTILAILPVLTHLFYSRDLTSPEKIMYRNDTGVILLDRKGRPFFTFSGAKDKQFVSLDQIPKDTQNAFVAIEDKSFWDHKGVSLRAIIRSSVANIFSGSLSYGGSTITQQLARGALLSSRKSFVRKYQELVLAREIEERYPKQKILEMYLNTVYMGKGCFGVEQCAQTYFGKNAKDLNIAQSAFLAGLLPAPSRLSDPASFPEAKKRQKLVLQKMREQRYINQDQEGQAGDVPLAFADGTQAIGYEAPHFAFLVLDQLNSIYGEEYVARSGFKVRTSLDLDWQKYAQESVSKNVTLMASRNVSNGAAVVLDPKSGEIRALVGSLDWSNSDFGKVNVATSLRQPGSSFKPILYAAALENQAITLASVLDDSPIEIKTAVGPYRPKNYDGKFRGKVLVRRALANSLNIPAVKVIQKIGVPQALSMARRLGITSLDQEDRFGPSLALGTGEVQLVQLVGAYAVFANEGKRSEPTTILEIKDKYGKQIYNNTTITEQILDPRVAFLISSILSDSKAREEEFGRLLTISRPAAVKTGTTQTYRDSWTVGYTPSLVVGVWVGNNSGRSMDRVAGSMGAAPIWKDLMEHYLAGTAIEEFKLPEGIVEHTICDKGNVLNEYFISGTEPKQVCIPPSPQLLQPPATVTTVQSPVAAVPLDNN